MGRPDVHERLKRDIVALLAGKTWHSLPTTFRYQCWGIAGIADGTELSILASQAESGRLYVSIVDPNPERGN
eukprot:g77131.t1